MKSKDNLKQFILMGLLKKFINKNHLKDNFQYILVNIISELVNIIGQNNEFLLN